MTASPSFPAYAARYLPAMTLRAIADLPDKAWAPVILTTGAIEQHGPHLPVAVDALMGQVFLERTIPLLAPGASCYVAPPITIGKSNEHTGFPGTLFISKETLREHLLTVARQIHTWGFRHLAILNTHGGNTAVIAYTLREITGELGLRTGFLTSDADFDLPAQEMAMGMHANTAETAWLQAVAPQYVRMEDAVCEYPGSIAGPGIIRPERAPATFAWISSDLSRSGIMGDAPAGSLEKGEKWLELGAKGYAKAISEIGESARQELAGNT
jgi:creatinine amidohydrolase